MIRRTFLLLILFVGAARAHELTITPVRAPGAAAGEVAITLRSPGREPLQRSVAAGESVVAEVPKGTWTIDVEGDRWWSARRSLFVNAALRVDILLWPAGEVRGRVKMPEGKPPQEVILRFVRGELSGESPCPVNDGIFRCHLPAGTLDLRLRAAGSVTRFFWNTAVDAAKPNDLGDVPLERGASLIGKVELASGVTADPKSLRVTATPANVDSILDASGNGRIRLLPLAATMEPKGVFHVDGVPAGEYTVVASAGRFRSPALKVTVYAGATAELREPLRVRPARQVRLLLSPPLDPEGKPWHVTVNRDLGPHRFDTVNESSASLTGELAFPNLFTGSYHFEIGPSGGGRWAVQNVDVADSDVTLPVAIPTREIHGTVTIGDRPLTGTVTLSSERSWDAVFHSDAEGHFSGVLPDPEARQWSARVVSQAPVVKRIVRTLTISENGRIDIALPLTAITGVVVDEAGHPVPHALIHVRGAGDLAATQAEADGSFSIGGLEPATYRIHAEAFLKESRRTEVTVTEKATDPVRLVLEDATKVQIRVFSEFGPVGGAQVLILPTDVPGALAPIEYTDAAGELSTTIAPGSKEIDVSVLPPGFAAKLFHTHVQGGTLNVRVDQRGGTISVPAPAGELHPFLFHNGALMNAEAYLGDWQARVEAGRIVISSIDGGVYAVCMRSVADARAAARADAKDCSSGILPQFGTLTLGESVSGRAQNARRQEGATSSPASLRR